MDKIILDIVGVVASLFTMLLATTLSSFLTSKVGEKKAKEIDDIISAFVVSAQQTLSLQTGAERKAYVVRNLAEIGIEVTEEINARIESKVFMLHNKM